MKDFSIKSEKSFIFLNKVMNLKKTLYTTAIDLLVKVLENYKIIN